MNTTTFLLLFVALFALCECERRLLPKISLETLPPVTDSLAYSKDVNKSSPLNSSLNQRSSRLIKRDPLSPGVFRLLLVGYYTYRLRVFIENNYNTVLYGNRMRYNKIIICVKYTCKLDANGNPVEDCNTGPFDTKIWLDDNGILDTYIYSDEPAAMIQVTIKIVYSTLRRGSFLKEDGSEFIDVLGVALCNGNVFFLHKLGVPQSLYAQSYIFLMDIVRRSELLFRGLLNYNVYVYQSATRTEYSPTGKYIFYRSDLYDAPHPLAHEFGHYVMDQLAPSVATSIDWNIYVATGEVHNFCVATTEMPIAALVEGYANAYALILYDVPIYGGTFYWDALHARSIEDYFCNTQLANGVVVYSDYYDEGRFAAMLYDLSDTRPDSAIYGVYQPGYGSNNGGDPVPMSLLGPIEILISPWKDGGTVPTTTSEYVAKMVPYYYLTANIAQVISYNYGTLPSAPIGPFAK